MTAELEDMMQEEMQEKILRNIAKNGKLSTEDLAAMLAASPEEIEKKNECDGRAGNYLRLSDFD